MVETRVATKFSEQAEKIISGGFRSGLTERQIQRRVRKSLGEKITLKSISDMKNGFECQVKAKKFFKRRGSDIVRDFLEKAKEGTDVTELQTVLTQAVYVDLLRRYESNAETMEEIGSKDFLKMASDFHKQNLSARAKAGSKKTVSALQAIQLVGILQETLGENPKLKELIEKKKPELQEKIKKYFNSEEYALATADYETMQRIREKYGEQRLNSKNSSNGRKPAGMAG